jgi:hypothetical protein
VPQSIDAPGTAGGRLRVAPARIDRHGTIVLDVLTDLFAVVRFVRAHDQRGPRRRENRLHGLAVVGLRAGQDKVERAAFSVDRRMDFRTPAAATDTDSLFAFPPLPPLAERCAFTTVLSIKRRPSRDLAANCSNSRCRAATIG